MASNLTAQVRNIADVATAIASGDLSKKITVDVRGEILFLKDTLNSFAPLRRKSPGWRAKWAPTEGWEDKRWFPASAAHGKT